MIAADRVAAHLGHGRPARPLAEGDLQTIYELGSEPERLVELATAEPA